ncbi:MAG: nucleoside triphosphatase [Clostridia bacterium]|nr:nucleoside triphosphatase [Clostridia bacterium]
MIKAIPAELKNNAAFCLWKYEQRNGVTTKVPYQVNGHKARSNDIGCFADYETVCAVADQYDGIGMGIFNGFSAIDIDHCVTDGRISDFAMDVISIMQSYTEFSPSGTGIRIIFKVDDVPFDKSKYYINNRNIGMEVYIAEATNKFVTITGRRVFDYEIRVCNDEIAQVLEKYMLRRKSEISIDSSCRSVLSDEEVLEKALNSKNAEKFIALWEGNIPSGKSASEADMALVTHLAFWCNKDAAQIDRLFRKSGLMRDKWDRKQSGSTYGNITIEKALNMISQTYGDNSSVFDDFSDIANMLKELDAYRAYPHNDNGTSRLFADVFKDCLRFVPQRKSWYFYDGRRWKADIGGLYAMERCKELMLELLRYSVDMKDSNYTAYCNKLQARNKRLIILNDAQSVYPIDMSRFDNDRFLFNCRNGTLNLKTMEFRSHSANDLITKLAPVDYEPSADCSRFSEFINEIMSNDAEKTEFLQKALGYSVSGDTRYECLFILYGATTRNGKGTLMESVLGVLGDYGKAVKPETIATKNNHSGSSPSEDVARLAGLRFANISEPSKGMVINAALLKSMTGNDTLNARFLHENSFDFKPQFKLYINTNYLPVINDITLFTSGRIIVIPFNRHFENNEQDKTLKLQFTEENAKSAILNWLIEGYAKLTETGMGIPHSVKEATATYEKENDKITLFADECLEENPRADVRTASVYATYREWCYDNGMQPESNRTFNQSLKRIGQITKKRPCGGGEKTTVLLGFQICPKYQFL